MNGEGGGGAAPSGGGGTGGAPAAAPSGGSAPGGAGSSAPNVVSPQTGSQQAPQSGAKPAPTRAPMLVKHKAMIGEGDAAQEHEIELDIAEHLAAQRFKFKADGEDMDLSWDEVQQRLPMSQAAWRRMSQSAEATKKAEALQKSTQEWRGKVENALRNPEQALALVERALGSRDAALKAMERYVAAHLAEQKLSPEQRQARADEQRRRGELDQNSQKLSAREKALAEREAAIQKQEGDRLTERFQAEWPKALAAEGLPMTKQTMRTMARIKSEAYKGGYDMSDAEAAREVKAEVSALLGGLDGNALGKVVPDAAKQLEQQRIADLNATTPGRVAQRSQAQQANAKRTDPKPEETWEEMHERITKGSEEKHQANLLRRHG